MGVIEDYPANICPDCEAGKHANCTNEAWDFEADEAVTCDCYTAGHPG